MELYHQMLAKVNELVGKQGQGDAVKTDEVWEVKNIFSDVKHRSLVNLKEPPAHWKTLCGWQFSGKPHAHTSRITEGEDTGGRPCPKCYPNSKPADSSSSTSSSSSCED